MSRLALLAAFLAVSLKPALAANDEPQRLSRHLADLYLGDTMAIVRKLYPPTADWPAYMDPKRGVRRIHIERGDTKHPAGRPPTSTWLRCGAARRK